MNFFGRIIGLLLGYKLLGLFGGIIGFFIGGMFDRGLKMHLHTIPRQHTENIQQAFFTATFKVMGHLAKSDGHVSEDEIEAVRNVMNRLELDENLRREAIRLFNEGKSANFNLDAALDALYQECRSHRDLLRFFIEIELGAALSDGPLQPEEQAILLKMCQKFGISGREFEQLWAQQWAAHAFHDWFSGQFEQGGMGGSRAGGAYGAWGTGGAAGGHQAYGHAYGHGQRHRHAYGADPAAALNEAYGVLGVPSSASPAEIKKAYKKLMNQHHPDKLVSRGLPESMMKLAHEKTQQITAAYNVVSKARGFR